MTKTDASLIATNAGRDASRVNLLLVENNLADARLVREFVKDAGAGRYEVTAAGSLAEGIRHLKAGHYDAVLLDLSLPDGFGVETVVRVQAETPTVPIVVLTGLDHDQAAIDAVRSGAAGGADAAR